MIAGVTRIEQSEEPASKPRFDVDVPLSGYRWWYVDGLSDDGRHGIVVIAFIGSVFSPYYFRARAKGAADPIDYCSINVGLYRPTTKLWAMTERGRASVERDPDRFRVGPSDLRWHDDRLEIRVRERSMPLGRAMHGCITVRPACIHERAFRLDAAGRHVWHPFAPKADIDVRFDRPALSWHGHAYVDSNAGSRPLEDDFRHWNWSRTDGDGWTDVTYAVTPVSGEERTLALGFGPQGEYREDDAPAAVDLPPSGWRVRRETRAESVPAVVRTLEDTPFYSRSLLASVGRSRTDRVIMHESLDLRRFCAGWVRLLLPFRMPRLK